MKTVLSNTKRFLAVFLALAMVVLAVPNAPTDLLAAEVDPEVEAVETTEAEAPVEEDAAAPAEAVEADEAVEVSEAAVGAEAEEEPEESSMVVGSVYPEDLYVLGARNDGEEDHSIVLDSATAATANASVVFIEAGHTALAIAADRDKVGADPIPNQTIGREEKMIAYSASDSAKWSVVDSTKDIISVLKGGVDPKNPGKTIITANKPGVAQVKVEYTKNNDVYSSSDAHYLTVYVYDEEEDVAKTTGRIDDNDVWVLNTINKRVEDETGTGTIQYEYDDDVVFNVLGRQAAESDVTWNIVPGAGELYDKTVAEGTPVIWITDNGGCTNNWVSPVVAGTAEVQATVTGVNAAGLEKNQIIFKEKIKVVDQTVAIKATRDGDLDEVSADPIFGLHSLTGNEWQENEKVEVGDTAVYNLVAVDSTGAEIKDVTYVTDYDNMGTHTGSNTFLNVEFRGSQMFLTGQKAATDDTFRILAKKTFTQVINGTPKEITQIVGAVKAHVDVTDTSKFAFTTKTGGENKNKYAFFSAAVGDGSGDSAESYGDEAGLHTTPTLSGKRTWQPYTINGLTPTPDDPTDKNTVTYNYDAAAAKYAYGKTTVNASMLDSTGKRVSDNYDVIILDVAKSGETKRLPVEDGHYQLELGIVPTDPSVTTNDVQTVMSSNDLGVKTVDPAGLTLARDSIVYESNTKYAESAKLSMLGAEAGTVTFDTVPVLNTVTGQYYTTVKADRFNWRVAEVAADGTITARATGSETVYVTYTEGTGSNKRTWELPVDVTVKRLTGDLEATANADPSVILSTGTSKINAEVRQDDTPITSGVVYTYSVESVLDESGKNVTNTYKNIPVFTGNVFGIPESERSKITEQLTFTVKVTAVVSYGGGIEDEARTAFTDVTVIPSASAKLKLDDSTQANLFKTRNTVTPESVLIENPYELDLVTVGTDTYPIYNKDVVKVEFVNSDPKDGYTVMNVTPIGTGKTTIYVNAVGSTEKPIAVNAQVFGVKGNNVTFDEETGDYTLTLQKVGEVYTKSTLSLYSESEDTPLEVTWSSDDPSKVAVGATTGEVKTVNNPSPDPSGLATITAKYPTTVDGKSYNATGLGGVTVMLDEIDVNVSLDARNKTISAETADNASDWTIVPTVKFSKDGKLVDGMDYTVDCKLPVNSKVSVTPSVDGKSLVINPLENSGLGDTVVTVIIKSLDGTVLCDTETCTVKVKAREVFTEHNTWTDTTVANPGDLYAFTNYAITEVGAAPNTRPQLQDVVKNNVKGKTFNIGWSWGKNSTQYVEDLIEDKAEQKDVEVVYQIKGKTVVKQEVGVYVATIDGIALEGTSTDGHIIEPAEEENTYEWKLEQGQTYQEIIVAPTFTKPDGKESTKPGFTTLFTANLQYDYEANGNAITIAKKDSLKVYLNTVALAEGKTGSGTLKVTTGGFKATLNVMTGAMVSGVYFVNSTEDLVTDNGDAIALMPRLQPDNWLWSKNFFMDLNKGDASADVKIAIPEADVTSNGSMDRDSSGIGIVTIDTSDSSVVELSGLNGSNMRYSGPKTISDGTGAPSQKYYVYTASINPRAIGDATITIELQDPVRTTKRFHVYVTNGRNPVAETVKMSRAIGKTSTADLNLIYPSNEFFTDGYDVWTDDGNSGYRWSGLVIGSDPTGQITSTSTGFKINDTSKVQPGTYEVIVRGDSTIWYHDEDKNETTYGQSDSFSNIPVSVVITDDAFVEATVKPVTVAQGGTASLEASIDTPSGFAVTSVEFKDPEAAAAAGLTISGLTIAATDNANIVDNKMYDVIVNGKKGDIVGYDEDVQVAISVEKADAPTATIGAVSVKQGGSVALEATWSDKKARTNTYQLVGSYKGLSVTSAGVLSATTEATLGAQTVNVEVTGTETGKDPIKSTVALAVTVTEKDPIVVDVTMSDISIRQGQSQKMKVKSITKGFEATTFAFAGEAPNGVAFTDSTTMTASSEAPIDTTGKDYVINVTATNGVETTIVPVTVNIKVLEASGGGNHDIEPTPETEQGLEDITNETYKAYQVENTVDLTKADAFTTVYFVGNVDPDAVELVTKDYFEITDTITDTGYTKVILALKEKTWTSAQAAVKNGKKVEFKLSKGETTATKTVKLTLKATATAPKITLTAKSGTAYQNGESKEYNADFVTSDKNGILSDENTTAIYVANKDSDKAVENINVIPNTLTGGVVIDYDNAGEQKSGGLYVTNSSWVTGLSVFAPFKITHAKSTAKPAIKLGKTAATIGNKAGQAYMVPITVGGSVIADDDYTITPDKTVEGVEAGVLLGYFTVVTNADVAADKITYTISAPDAAKPVTFKLTVTDKEAKASYSVKGKLDAVADDTAVYLIVKPSNATGAIELTDDTKNDLASKKLKYSFVNDTTIKIEKDLDQFTEGFVPYMEKGNITINNFAVTVGGIATKAAKVNIPVVQGKLTATGSAIDIRGEVGVEEGTSAIEAVYTYTVYNAAGKAETKKYYTFAGEAVKLTSPKAGKATATPTDDGLVKVTNFEAGKDVNGTVKVTVAGTTIKDVTAKFKVLGKNK